jgi:hypothetical protein
VGQAAALGQVGLDLDEADHLLVQVGRESGAAVGVPVGHAPGPQPLQAGVDERSGRLPRVEPVHGPRPAQQPVDLGGAAVGLADLVAAAVAQQVGGGHHPLALLGHQGDSLGHPGSTMNSPGSRSSWLMTVLTDTDTPGTTAWMWALTSAVSCSRSARRNGRTWTEDMVDLHCDGATRARGAGRPLLVRYASEATRPAEPAGQGPV